MLRVRSLCLYSLACFIALPALAQEIPKARKARARWEAGLEAQLKVLKNADKALRGSLKLELAQQLDNLINLSDIVTPGDAAVTGYEEIGSTLGGIYLQAQNVGVSAITSANADDTIGPALAALAECWDTPPCDLSGDSRKFAIAVSPGRGGAWDDFAAAIEARLAKTAEKLRKSARTFTSDLRGAAKEVGAEVPEIAIGVKLLAPRLLTPTADRDGSPETDPGPAPIQVTTFLAATGDVTEVRVQGLGTPDDDGLELEFFVLDSVAGGSTSVLDEVAAPVSGQGRWLASPAGLDPGVYRIEIRSDGEVVEAATVEFPVF